MGVVLCSEKKAKGMVVWEIYGSNVRERDNGGAMNGEEG